MHLQSFGDLGDALGVERGDLLGAPGDAERQRRQRPVAQPGQFGQFLGTAPTAGCGRAAVAVFIAFRCAGVAAIALPRPRTVRAGSSFIGLRASRAAFVACFGTSVPYRRAVTVTPVMRRSMVLGAAFFIPSSQTT
ncbi:hypothetical protein OG245_00140 [Streptomyces sp. NBC_01116]|uniref:hypothetical protein n=1 Tax=Streptomyces sp. NBC_01116 TaxID=2903752 RepID=UPI00324E8BA1